MAAPSVPAGGADTGTDPAPTTATPESAGKKKGRTNTPWTAEEEQRLKTMRDAGKSWSEIAKTFPTRTEGSVKKHWYKVSTCVEHLESVALVDLYWQDMHYAEFAEDESIALREAIKEYEANKWKVIGQKVGKPAKVGQIIMSAIVVSAVLHADPFNQACEQYAKEHFKNI
ncbi:Vitamin B6 transporter [Paecilomyces lecythidis]